MRGNTGAVRACAWIATFTLAAVHAWAGRHFVNPDGVSYLDLSDDYAAGSWGAAVNGYWSPLYPILLAGVRKLLRPSPYWEATTVHAVNALLFIVSLATFELFLREIRARQTARESVPEGTRPLMLLETPGEVACGYALFLFGGVSLITIREVTPDMLIAVLAFWIAALVVRIQRGSAGARSFVALGVVLGLSYLTKAVMFPVSLLILALSLVVHRRKPQAIRYHLLAAATFAIVSAPQVIAMSRLGGYPSFGHNARIAYGMRVNDYPKHWTGERPGSGQPANPIRVLSVEPTTYVFPLDKPNRSFPLWDEPAHWYAGLTPQFSASDQLRAIEDTFRTYAGMLVKLLIPILLLLLVREHPISREHRLLILISAGVLGLYGIVHTEPRLVAPWIVVGTIAIMASFSILPGTRSARYSQMLVHVVTAVCVISIAAATVRATMPPHDEAGLGHVVHSQSIVADAVNSVAAPRGSRVALVGDESDIYWARLAGVQVAFHIPLTEAPRYWALEPAERDALNARLANAGAAAIVASWTGPAEKPPPWVRVGDRQFSILPLRAAPTHSTQPR